MGSFIKDHVFSIFCLLALIWLAAVIKEKLKYKKHGIPLTGTVVENKTVTGNLFPVFEFEYEGETLRVDSYEGTKSGAVIGAKDTVYYIPGNTKGVFREDDLKPKPWMFIGGILAAAYIVMDLVVLHK